MVAKMGARRGCRVGAGLAEVEAAAAGLVEEPELANLHPTVNRDVQLLRHDHLDLSDLEVDVEIAAVQRVQVTDLRSEEHTSELQSLMCISYAVFCFKKKKTRAPFTSA